ncbi:DUF6301 family protein [Micromonospora sp. DT81.3]|uniref:DUF6301 family protein n=1 Tax=Actinomycetes TaxID=1760 RepID=UPI003CEBE80C
MTVSSATIDDLRPIVDAFAEFTWPAPRDSMHPVAEKLGWTLQLDRPKGINYQTAYGFGRGRASVLISDDDIAEVTVHVSARIDEDDQEQRAQLAQAFSAVRGALEQILGTPAHVRRGEYPRISWDLASGGRIALDRLGAVVALTVLQQKYADIERFEESRGIPDDRDPEADLV